MMKHVSLFGVAALLFLTNTAASDELIELKSGQALRGEVLKERPHEILVDIGVDVVRVPRDQVAGRRSEGADQGDADDEPAVRKQGVFRTADLPVSNVKDLAAQFGEGVVLVRTPSGLGSGFVLNEDGYCVTNYHVVERETRISVTIFQKLAGEFVRRKIDNVRIVALNPFLDLALLRIPRQDDLEFTPVYLADSNDDMRVGETVFAIGNPLGLERTVSKGIVSTRNRNFGGLVYVQTTADINPGNSGGPLFNLRGEVVGVTNMKVPFGEGLGFAIPIHYVKHFLNNRDAFLFDRDNPNTGYHYLDPPRRRRAESPPPALFEASGTNQEKANGS